MHWKQPVNLKKDRKSIHLIPAQTDPSIANWTTAIATLTCFVDSHTLGLDHVDSACQSYFSRFVRFLFEIAYSLAIPLF